MGRMNFGSFCQKLVGVGWKKIREVDELGDFGGISSSKS